MWIKIQILEACFKQGGRKICVSSIYQQGNYTWQLVLLWNDVISWKRSKDFTSHQSRYACKVILLYLLFKNHTSITLTYCWLFGGMVFRLVNTQIMQIEGGKKEVRSSCVYISEIALIWERPPLRPHPQGQAVNLTKRCKICGGQRVYAKLQRDDMCASA